MTREDTYSCGLVLWGLVLFPHHPRDFGGLLRDEQLHKGFQALGHDSLKIL